MCLHAGCSNIIPKDWISWQAWIQAGKGCKGTQRSETFTSFYYVFCFSNQVALPYILKFTCWQKYRFLPLTDRFKVFLWEIHQVFSLKTARNENKYQWIPCTTSDGA